MLEDGKAKKKKENNNKKQNKQKRKNRPQRKETKNSDNQSNPIFKTIFNFNFVIICYASWQKLATEWTTLGLFHLWFYNSDHFQKVELMSRAYIGRFLPNWEIKMYYK